MTLKKHLPTIFTAEKIGGTHALMRLRLGQRGAVGGSEPGEGGTVSSSQDNDAWLTKLNYEKPTLRAAGGTAHSYSPGARESIFSGCVVGMHHRWLFRRLSAR